MVYIMIVIGVIGKCFGVLDVVKVDDFEIGVGDLIDGYFMFVLYMVGLFYCVWVDGG